MSKTSEALTVTAVRVWQSIQLQQQQQQEEQQ